MWIKLYPSWQAYAAAKGKSAALGAGGVEKDAIPAKHDKRTAD
jgi:hypothetical protein